MKCIHQAAEKAAAASVFLFGVIFFSMAAQAAAAMIQAGDLLNVQYTCRLQSGEIVDTTDPATAADGSQRKSRIFVAKDSYAAVPMQAGDAPRCAVDRADAFLPHKEFEKEVAAKIAKALVGKPVLQTVSVELTSDEQTDLPDQERYVQVARTTQLPKKLQVARGRFEQQFAANPRVGGTLDLYPELDGRITAVTENMVAVRFEARSAAAVPGAFGEAVVHEKDEHFIIEVQARQGDLVRTGPVLGRVSNVQETTLTLDFGHPFGGRTLYCDITAEPVTGAALTTAAAGSVCSDGNAVVQPGAKQPSDTGRSSAGPTDAEDLKAAANPNVVQKDDLVEIDYVVSTSDGKVVATTMAEVYADPHRKIFNDFVEPQSFAPLMIKAGAADGFPGLSDNVLGMRVGQKRKVELAPGQAFEPHDPRLVSRYPKTRYIPKTVTIAAEDYIERFGSFPVVGREVAYNPYLDAAVQKIDAQTALLNMLLRDENFREDYGTVHVREEPDRFAIILEPALGALFTLQSRRGRIIADDGSHFTVDFNHPLAGEPLSLEVKLISLRKPSLFRGLEIQWIEDYDTGLEIARAQNKPAVLVLYADWCGYSSKLLEESMTDPRIKLLKDNFVWIKVDSHKNSQYKARFEQSSYPLIVVLSPAGDTLKRLKGYQAAPILRQELKHLINTGNQIALGSPAVK